MKNQYFKKDKKAQVYVTGKPIEDELGQMRPSGYYPISPISLWCYARQNSQTLSFTEGIAYINDESRFFVFNNNPLIKQATYIKYRDIWYTVSRVDTQDDYNGDMYVYASDTPIGGVPKKNDVHDYDPNQL